MDLMPIDHAIFLNWIRTMIRNDLQLQIDAKCQSQTLAPQPKWGNWTIRSIIDRSGSLKIGNRRFDNFSTLWPKRSSHAPVNTTLLSELLIVESKFHCRDLASATSSNE